MIHMKNIYTITEEMLNEEFGSIENFCSTIKQYGECRICLDERDKVKCTLSKEKIKTCNTANKIMVVGTLDVIIDTVDAFLMIHSQATLQDFINFLRRTRHIYLGQERSKNNES